MASWIYQALKGCIYCWSIGKCHPATLEGDKMSTWSNTYPHKPKGRLMGPYTITMLTEKFTWGLIHDRTCLTEAMQTLLILTKSQPLNPIRTSKHCDVLIKWTQLNGYVVRKNTFILIIQICSEYGSTNGNLVTKITTTLLKPHILVQVQICNEYNIYIP